MRVIESRVALRVALILAGALGCGGSGLGAGVRDDVTSQMAKVQQPIAACYGEALKRNRKLAGTMTVTATAAPETGAFENVSVANSALGDEALQACVVEQVSALALDKPQKTAVSVTYPLEFAPTN